MSDDDNKDNVQPPEENKDTTTTPESTTPASGQNTYQFDEAALEDPDEAALGRQGSAIGGNSGKAVTFGIILILGTIAILYYLFSAPSTTQTTVPTGAVPTKPSGQNVVINAPGPPPAIGLPTPVAPTTPPAPPPPPPPPAPPKPPAVVKTDNALPPKPLAPLAPPEIKAIAPANNVGVIDKRAATRMRSNMLLLNGTAAAPSDKEQNAKNALNANDPNAAFSSNVIAASEAEVEIATKMANLNRLIAQGKIVYAVLETAINSDLPGTLRAVVSRDVYAEAGKNVLIPKGSRLIGTYNTGILRGQKRVMIVWTRVMTPSGIDIQIGSPGVDSLGRAGVQGVVDNKYMEAFSGALLTSMITVGIAVAADSNINGSSTTTTNTDGSSSSSGSAGANAINGAVGTIGNVATEVVGDLLDLRPTITIDQGTRINVFVNKDLEFPGPDASGSLFVQ